MLDFQCTLVGDMSVGNTATRTGGLLEWLILATVPSTALLVLASSSQPIGWEQLAGATTEMIVLVVGRWVVLGVSMWLLATQLLYTVAVVTRTNWLEAVLRPITLPLVRRIAAGATAMSLSFCSLAAVAQSEPTTTVVQSTEIELRQEATPTPILQPLVEPDPTEEPADIVIEPEGSYSAPLTWLVRPGDHLWLIAGEHLAIVLDRTPTADEHRRYWVRMVKAACPEIRSGDPDLIYPGEEILLPPTLDAGITP